MSFELLRPSPQELYNRVSSNFSSVVLGGSPVIPESVESYVVANDYAAQEEFYSIAAQEWRERDPRTACCSNLVKLAADRGVYPKAAGFAEGYVKITGVAGSTVPNPLTVQFGAASFSGVGSIPATIPASGEIVVRVKAIVPGSSGNKITAPGNLTSPATGISQVVTAFGENFCGGAEVEECEVFRQRFIDRMKYQPRATEAWIKTKISEWPCVTRVVERAGTCLDGDGSECGCSCNACQGRLEFYAMFDGSFKCGLAPQSVINDLNAWLWGSPVGVGKGQVEIGVCGKIYTATAMMVDIKIYGLSCVTASQQNEIKSQIAEIFSRVSPSSVLQRRQIELSIAQIVGTNKEFDTEFIVPNGGGHVSLQCDLVPDCDFMPCLQNITFATEDLNFNGCQ